jgi:hypothetical protein
MRIFAPISRVRFIAVAACLSAVVIYSSNTPGPAYAWEETPYCNCNSGDQSYGHGACSGTSECRCSFNGGICLGCDWYDNSDKCKPLND